MRQLLTKLPLPGSTAGQRALAHATRDPLTRFALWHQVTPPTLLDQLINRKGREKRKGNSKNFATSASFAVDSYHPLNQFLALEAQTRLVDFINFEVDRMSMANSVEARPPFLDHKLWEFCATLPPELKLNGAMNKVLLRLGMKELLPTAVTNRPKQGLATPHAAWWRSPKLPAWAEECLQPISLRETGYFNGEVVGRLRDEHGNGRTDHSRILTGILTTQIWHQEMKVIE